MARRLRIFTLILLAQLCASSCDFLSHVLSGQSLAEIPGEGAPKPENVPLPDTQPYDRPLPDPGSGLGYTIEAGGHYSADQKFIVLSGFTRKNGLPAAATIKIIREGTPQSALTQSQADGSFAYQLPIEGPKPTDVLRLFTIDADENITSNEAVVVLDKLYGLWRGAWSIDWSRSDAHCLEQAPALAELEKIHEIDIYRPQPYAGYVLLFMMGVERKIHVDQQMKMQAQGSFALDPRDGFLHAEASGCYEKANYAITGSFDPNVRPDGAHAKGSGELKVDLSGSGCGQSCHLEGRWNYEKFLPLYVFSFPNEDVITYRIPERHGIRDMKFRHIFGAKPELGQLFGEQSHAHRIPDGPLSELTAQDAQRGLYLGLGRQHVYQMDLSQSGQETLERVFRLEGEPDIAHFQSANCGVLTRLAQIDAQHFAVAAHDRCSDKPSLWVFSTAAPGLRQRVALPAKLLRIDAIAVRDKVLWIEGGMAVPQGLDAQGAALWTYHLGNKAWQLHSVDDLAPKMQGRDLLAFSGQDSLLRLLDGEESSKLSLHSTLYSGSGIDTDPTEWISQAPEKPQFPSVALWEPSQAPLKAIHYSPAHKKFGVAGRHYVSLVDWNALFEPQDGQTQAQAFNTPAGLDQHVVFAGEYVAVTGTWSDGRGMRLAVYSELADLHARKPLWAGTLSYHSPRGAMLALEGTPYGQSLIFSMGQDLVRLDLKSLVDSTLPLKR